MSFIYNLFKPVFLNKCVVSFTLSMQTTTTHIDYKTLHSLYEQSQQQNQALERLQLRQAEAGPLLEQLGQWIKQQYIKVLPQSPIGKALGYSIERWKELMIYTTNGKLNIDNNPKENSIRPVAIGRKNYLPAYRQAGLQAVTKQPNAALCCTRCSAPASCKE